MRADTITKEYVRDVNVFADIFNYYVYKGRQVIQPDQLTERDSTKIALPYGEDGAVVPVQKFRDVQKLYAAMTDGKLEYLLYGVENQAEVHYAMPVKNNLYEALEYAGQVEEAAKSHRKSMKQRREQAGTNLLEDKKTPNAGEFLSGFWKEDRLIPSITITVFFGVEKWDGPLSLFEMMDVSDPDVLACMSDYRLHLIAPAQMPDEEIMKFQSSMREVMFFIKYSKDRESLDRILRVDERRFREMERRAVDVIEAITNAGLKYEEDEEAIDVCQAIQEMRMESEQKGRLEGERQGRLAGEQQGRLEGEMKKAQEVARKLHVLGMSKEKISSTVGYSVEMIEQWLNADLC